MFRRLVGLGLVLALASCASVSQRSPVSDIDNALQGLQAPTADMLLLLPNDPAISARIDNLLTAPLTPDGAVEVSLLASPEVKAAALSLAAAWAEVRHAAKIDNPEIDVAALFGAGPALLEFGLMQSIGSLVTQKKRLQTAESQYDVAVQQVTGRILEHALQTRQAVVAYEHASRQLQLLEEAVTTAQAASALADAMLSAGNLPAADNLAARLAASALQMEYLSAQQRQQAARTELSRLMGILHKDQGWTLAPQQLDLPPVASVAVLFERARSLQPDLAIQRAELLALAAERKLVNAEHILPHLTLGAVAERDDGAWKGGPALGLELPIFDTGRTDHQAFEARIQVAQMAYLTAEQSVLADITTYRSGVLIQQDRIVLAQQRVELAQDLLNQTLRKYNYMLVGGFDVLEARQGLLKARQKLAEAESAYLMAINKLQMAVGAEPFQTVPETGGE